MGHWAEAIWDQWLDRRTLEKWYIDAKAKLAKAKSVWGAVTGPAAAALASMARIRWTDTSFIEWIDDIGQLWHLGRDSPAAVCSAIEASVRRWQQKRAI